MKLKSNKNKLSWGILGTGYIAGHFAADLPHSKTGTLRAIGSRNLPKAQSMAAEFGGEGFGSYEEVLNHPEVNAVYLALPNHLHAEWSIRAARAGKHILCEKPIALNRAEAMAVLEAARRSGVFFMEAYMYRCHPVMEEACELLRKGILGEVRAMRASFSYQMPTDTGNIRFNNAMGGGSIMDVGGYCLSMLRLLAGAALGRNECAEPLELRAVAAIGNKSRVDEWSTAVVKFESGILGQMLCGSAINTETAVTVWGTEGSLTIPNPWFPGRQGPGVIQLHLAGKKPKVIENKEKRPLYAIEADRVAEALPATQASYPCMTWPDSMKQIEFIDQWRQQVGVVFDSEKPAALKLPVDRRPLKYAACAEHAMRYGQVGENPKKVSRLVLGTMAHLLPNQAQANVLLDHFFSCGGSALDTAHVYGTEEIVGRWLATRKARSEIFLIGKGAAFEITPENVLVELNQSLARLNTDHLDLYMMHRDNEKVPVGEFVDVLAGLQKKGIIKAYGGSNWSKERLAAAEKYAVKNGLPPIGGSSPNFCLARWNQPMWSGCISACDPASREFYRKTQLPLFAWSATASGFLAGRFQPSDAKKLGPEDPAVATWFNPDNFRRLRNLERLSAKLQVPPAALALAYIFHQGLNAFALIGPQTINEMNDSLSSLSVEWTNEINEQLEKI
jgi:predicted dehydrogenase/aryl-alcohol dehydrogenase-like predicted oxidoreductase